MVSVSPGLPFGGCRLVVAELDDAASIDSPSDDVSNPPEPDGEAA